MGEFPSGQRGQTVNLLRIASMVRIRPPPPQKRHTIRCVSFVRMRICGRIRPAIARRIRPLYDTLYTLSQNKIIPLLFVFP